MEKDYWKCDENAWNFRRKSTEICRKMQNHQHFRNDFHWTAKIKLPACKILTVWTKNEEKILRFFNQNLYGKLTCFTILSWIYIGALTPLWKYIPLEDNARFLQQFSDFPDAADKWLKRPKKMFPVQMEGNIINLVY